jgi:hypothetical protein
MVDDNEQTSSAARYDDDANVDVLRLRAEYYARNVQTRTSMSSDNRVINCDNSQVLLYVF